MKFFIIHKTHRSTNEKQRCAVKAHIRQPKGSKIDGKETEKGTLNKENGTRSLLSKSKSYEQSTSKDATKKTSWK